MSVELSGIGSGHGVAIKHSVPLPRLQLVQWQMLPRRGKSAAGIVASKCEALQRQVAFKEVLSIDEVERTGTLQVDVLT